MSQAELHGVVPTCNGQFQLLQQSSVRWSNQLKQAIAVCHGLAPLSKSALVGDDTERSLFKEVEARFVVGPLTHHCLLLLLLLQATVAALNTSGVLACCTTVVNKTHRAKLPFLSPVRREKPLIAPV